MSQKGKAGRLAPAEPESSGAGKRTENRRRQRLPMAFALMGLALSAGVAGQTSGGTGEYKDLLPEQQRPIRDLVERYNQISGKNEDAAKLYNSARLSVRTTYDAITNALLTTKLTAADGRPLGSALEMIDVIEEIAGEVRGAPGDRQFRVYVTLKEGAVERLEQSTQFRRGADNTVYHRGYPMSYRMAGVPSIQVSIARDRRRADVDVDYRSSAFPAGLFNGHLTAANSDVRIGDNYARHAERWQGLFRWWLSFFGATAVVTERAEEAQKELALDARAQSRGKLEPAVKDFFTTWLVEGQAAAAVSYFSRESFGCLEQDAKRQGKELPAGLTLVKTKIDMDRYAKSIGGGKAMRTVLEPVKGWDSRLRPVKQAEDNGFSLFELPESMVKAELACQLPEPGGEDRKGERYGKYYGSVTRFARGDGGRSGAVLMIWTKDHKRWKIVGVKSADAEDPAVVSLERREVGEEERPGEEANPDPEIVPAAKEYLESWLVRRDYKKAMAAISPRARGCVENAGQDRGEAGFAQVAKRVGRVKELTGALRPVSVWNRDTRIVRHAQENAYTLLSIPDGMAQSLLCENRGKPVSVAPGSPVYGRYYLTLFVIRGKKEATGALSSLWEKEDGRWKLIAWELQAP